MELDHDYSDDFPALSSRPKPMVYLDSAATTLKPNTVVDAVRWFLENGTSSVHRAFHTRSIDATDRFEGTRERLARWFGADTDEIVLTHGTTEAINLVRHGWQGLRRVATTLMEHHSNFVPWMDLERCDVIHVDSTGTLDWEGLEHSLKTGIDLVAVTQMSNVLAAAVDLERLVPLVHRYGARVLIDAAQTASHDPPNVRNLGIDFLACSGHKMLGPSGCGALYVKRELHEELKPMLLGGHMVDHVFPDSWTIQKAPQRYEAGTPPIESVIGWGAAIDYLQQIGTATLKQHLSELSSYLIDRLESVPGVKIVGPSRGQSRGPLASFSVEGLEASAIARILAQRDEVFVRAGFHCAQPLHQTLGLRPSVRASLQIYNTRADIDRFAKILGSVAKLGVM
ncbi:putative cysteine desulfurase [Rubripirellula amarantea]|uniref:cysteine desulfurase n=1 Tax=Rubripirellula amarantea TaxID=2527999 RepID=A0A5C5WXD7_9BACT|nr:cysteine desulfurase [Rubripirellula amarantea]TWT54663.1 putative cysteine desulfurase [Rubripirellula amarantea]